MVAFRRILLAAVATLLVAGACTSITLPTIPAIGGPGFTLPPIVLPSFPVGVPGFTLPPIGLPGGGGNTGTTPCTLVTGAEVGQIMGSTVTDQSDEATDCSFLLPNFSAISVQATSDTDFSGVQFLMGQSATQSTVAGLPALSGTVLGQAALYVQKGANQLQVLGILTGSDPTTIAKLQQIAAIAVGRMP